jgi:hypothetical protein
MASQRERNFLQGDMYAMDYANAVTIYTNPERAKEIDNEIDEIWAAINAIKDTAYDREEQPNYVKRAVATLDIQLKALYVEYDSLIDKEATEIARSKRLQYALGVATM